MLQIAVLGCGGIGSTFAYHLSRFGHDVTVIARAGSVRLQQLQRDSAIVNAKGERAPVRVVAELDEAKAFDLLLLTTPSPILDSVLPSVQRCAAKAVITMFNVYDPTLLRKNIGANRCSFGFPAVIATLDNDGLLTSSISGQTSCNDQRWVEAFTQAGINTYYEPDMNSWLRSHVPMAIAFLGVSAARSAIQTWCDANRMCAGRAGHA